ncbi:hypothetical protein [Elioraea tepidiphila]|uniref:hypothetical protein n=1 Tax=Elioraea tepidiphila TaxID=457934 RepID=UPI0003764272|nr:hypothetical protein [Elioraea tepidiphila]
MLLIQTYGTRLKAPGARVYGALPLFRPTGGGGGGGVLIETVILDNFSGASRTDPNISFARDFLEGEVPAGSRVELRYGGEAIALQQADGLSYHGDGSLRRAVFSCKPSATIADNGTIAISLHAVQGGGSGSSPISRSTLTAQDYRMRLRIDGIDCWCVLNNLDAAGTFRERRAGPVVRAWHHWGVFRQGTGASDTDQGQWQGHFYSYVWADGTITIFPYAINGRVANSQSYTVQEFEFLNGSSSIISHTTSFTAYGWSAYFLCTADGLPHWSANATHVHPRASWRWFHDHRLIWNTYDSATVRASVPVPAPLSYSPATPSGAFGDADINQSGASAWIGDIPDWDAHALLATSGTEKSAADRATLLRNSRVNALAMGVKFPAWLVRHESGHPPVIVNQDYTSRGLTPAQPAIGWASNPTLTRSGGTFPGSATDASHQPQYPTYQAMVTGWEWWLDFMVILGVGCIGREDPSNAVDYSRRPLVNGASRDCGTLQITAHRQNAWKHKIVCDAEWIMPDAHPCKPYMNQLLVNGFAIAEQFLTPPEYAPDRVALGVWRTSYGGVSNIGFAPWQAHGYFVPTICMSVHRGRITTAHKLVTEHISKQLFGVINACPYRGAGLYTCAWREGPQPTTASPIAQNWDTVYCSHSSDQISGLTIKLISDAGGSGGACPTSGLARPIDGGHSYPNLARRACETGAMVGIPAAGVALAYLRAEEAAAGITDASRAIKPQWGTRTPE